MIRQILLSILLPGVLAGAVLVIAWRGAGRRRWGAPLALGAAFLASFVAESGWAALRPTERLAPRPGGSARAICRQSATSSPCSSQISPLSSR